MFCDLHALHMINVHLLPDFFPYIHMSCEVVEVVIPALAGYLVFVITFKDL